MTKTGRRRFIGECMAGMRKTLIKIADEAPEHWDGRQLRVALREVAQRYRMSVEFTQIINEVKSFLDVHNL